MTVDELTKQGAVFKLSYSKVESVPLSGISVVAYIKQNRSCQWFLEEGENDSG